MAFIEFVCLQATRDSLYTQPTVQRLASFELLAVVGLKVTGVSSETSIAAQSKCHGYLSRSQSLHFTCCDQLYLYIQYMYIQWNLINLNLLGKVPIS